MTPFVNALIMSGVVLGAQPASAAAAPREASLCGNLSLTLSVAMIGPDAHNPAVFKLQIRNVKQRSDPALGPAGQAAARSRGHVSEIGPLQAFVWIDLIEAG